METTIDEAGRLTIPEAIRESTGLVPGTVVSVTMRDGVIELRRREDDTALVLEDGVLVFTGKPLDDLERAVREQREARIRSFDRQIGS